jgi:spoIIIJ-associated protein
MNTTSLIQELLQYMGYEKAEVEEREVDGRVKIDVRLVEARELIGEKGATLSLFQHLARRIIDIDINGYKKIRENILKDFALDIGERVRFQKKSVELDPMPSFDRRVIHLTLAGYPDLATESTGEGLHRFIIVKPYP